MYFIFNLEYMYAALSRGMLYKLSTKSHAQQKSNYPSEMSETQWPYTLRISLNRKNQMVRFSKLEGLVWANEIQRLVSKYRIFRFLLANFQWLVLGDKYKSFFPPSFGGCWCYPQNTLILSLCQLSPIPLCEDLVICEKS
jgi:hypothetical protein